MLRTSKPFAASIGRQWRLLVAIGVLTALHAFLVALQPWPLKILLDSLTGKSLTLDWLPKSTASLIPIAALAGIAISFAMSGLNSALSWFWAMAGQRLVLDLSTTLYERLLRVSMRYHHRNGPGDALARLSTDTWSIYQLTSRLFAPVEQLFSIATIGVFAWRLNPELATFSLAVSPMLALTTWYFGKRMKSRSRSEREAESRASSFVHQTLSAMPMVQAFGSEERNSLKFERLAASVAQAAQQRAVVTSAYGMLNGFIATLGSCLVTYFGALQVMEGRLSVGSLLVFIAYARNLQTATEGLLKTYGELKPVEASIERVVEVLDPSTGGPADAPDARIWTPSGAPRIVFDHVNFSYDPDSPVLHDISLEIEAGQVVAFVGETGAGKSSLAALVPRFFDVSAGKVLLNDVDVKRYTVASLRAQMAFVLQEPFLMPLTVAENIGYAKAGASPEEIERAARLARAHEFIQKMPNGYETVLEQGGSSLSGGEKQRIAIARAILKDASIVILDEPTSALDARTESELMQDLEQLMVGHTCLVIAHRLSTVRRADLICVLSAGRIVERGTHDQLLLAGGAYARLHLLQSAEAGQ